MGILTNKAAENLKNFQAEAIPSAKVSACSCAAESNADSTCCDCLKHKHRDADGREYKALMSRLNRVEGQVRGVKNMYRHSYSGKRYSVGAERL